MQPHGSELIPPPTTTEVRHASPAVRPSDRRVGAWRLGRRLPPHHLAERWSAWSDDLSRAALLYRIDRHATRPGSEARVRRRFLELADLSHPHLLSIHLVEPADDGAVWIASEFPGSRAGLLTLPALAAQKPSGGVSMHEAWHAAQHLLSALDSAHSQGVAHGSLRMDDLLVNPRGAVVIELFGVEAALRSNEPLSESAVRADVRAACGVVHELLTGLPSAGSAVSVVRARGRAAATWDDWLTAALGPPSGFATAREALDSLPQQ